MKLTSYLLLGVLAQSFVSAGACSDPYEQDKVRKVRPHEMRVLHFLQLLKKSHLVLLRSHLPFLKKW